MSANYESILNQKLGDFKEIPPAPEGTYLATIVGMPKIGKMGQKQNLGIEFGFKLTEPMQDVDTDALAVAGGMPEEPLTYTFWLTAKAAYIAQHFLCDVLGVEKGTSIPDACQQVVGSQCLVVLKHGKSQKSGKTFANIDGFAKVE